MGLASMTGAGGVFLFRNVTATLHGMTTPVPKSPFVLQIGSVQLDPSVLSAHELLNRVGKAHPKIEQAVEQLRNQVRMSVHGSSLALIMAIPEVRQHRSVGDGAPHTAVAVTIDALRKAWQFQDAEREAAQRLVLKERVDHALKLTRVHTVYALLMSAMAVGWILEALL